MERAQGPADMVNYIFGFIIRPEKTEKEVFALGREACRYDIMLFMYQLISAMC